MHICDYGCGQEATYQFKNGKWCCSKNVSQCPSTKKRISEWGKTRTGKLNSFYGKTHTYKSKQLISNNRSGMLSGEDHPLYGKTRSDKTKEKISLSNKGKCKGKIPWNKGKTYEELYGKEKAKFLKKKHSNEMKNRIPWNEFTLDYIQMYHPFFFRIEEMRYNPENRDKKEIQVHCKNHNCPNSKEQGGWFTPIYSQLYERIRQIESEDGQGGCYFYCSDKCKESCVLYNLKSDPFKDTSMLYTYEEYNTWKTQVLKQDNYECQKCGSKENLHCHHIIPIKIEPMFSLDPDNGIVLCEKCHYKYGHKTGTECSTGNLAAKQCRGNKL